MANDRMDPWRDYAPGTRAIHAGAPLRENGRPLRDGPVFASAYHASGDAPFDFDVYGRSSNPTWRAYELALSSLEDGDTVVFPSGLAALLAVFESALPARGVLIMQDDAYYSGRRFATQTLRARGTDVRLVPTHELETYDLSACNVLLIETPTNPLLNVCDIGALAQRCKKTGTLLAVDNTLMTPILQAPLAMGADISISSDTKALAGHSDVLLGHVSTRDAELAKRLRAHRESTGSIPGPMEVWLAHRSLATLDVRMRRQCANAAAIADAVRQAQPELNVCYPQPIGAPGGMGGPLLHFTLDSAERTRRFFANCRLVAEATSFGGVHSTAERRARWEGDAVPEGFIRFSAGCEDTDDLVRDVVQALRAAYSPQP